MNDVFGTKLGRYVLLELLGKGGMARVYNALDTLTENNVAVKIMLTGRKALDEFRKYFENEAKTLAKLSHTNIVKVLDYGMQADKPYLVMEYISGGSVRDVVKHKLSWWAAAQLLSPIARALEYVHSQKIVHLDVKPSNILLKEDGTPMLADFGVLQLLEKTDGKIDSAIVMGRGTPEYMPPEQSGQGESIDFRADIYSLGLVFYELITGYKPFSATSPFAAAIKHHIVKLIPPSDLDPTIPKFVEAVILRAVQSDQNERFSNMGDFALALEMIARGKKAPKRKILKLTRLPSKRVLGSRPRAFALVVMLAIVSAIIGSYFRSSKMKPGVLGGEPTIITSVSQTSTLTAAVSTGVTQTPVVVNTRTPVPVPSLPADDVTLLGTPLSADLPSQFKEVARWGIGGVNVVRWSPDGTLLALGATSGIFLYDSQTGELIRFIDTGSNVLDFAFDPSGTEIAVGGGSGDVSSWNYESGRLVQIYNYSSPDAARLENGSPVSSISYASHGGKFAVGYANGSINYFSKGNRVAIWSAENFPSIKDLEISDDGRFLYVSSGGNQVDIWNLQDGTRSKVSMENPSPVNRLSISRNRKLILAGGGERNQSVFLWRTDVSNGENNIPLLVGSFPNLGARAFDFSFSYDDKYIAIGLENGEIKLFENPLLSNQSAIPLPKMIIDDYQFPILSVSFSPHELLFATGNLQSGAALWGVEDNKPLYEISDGLRGIDKLYISNNGKWIATSHVDGVVRLWDVDNAEEVQRFNGYLAKGQAFSADNRFLVFVNSVGKFGPEIINVFDLNNNDVVAKLDSYEPRAFMTFSDDTQKLVVGTVLEARVWDVATWEEINIVGGRQTQICGYFFTPDSEALNEVNTPFFVVSDGGVLFSFDEQVQNMCITNPKGIVFKYFFKNENQQIFIRENGDLLIVNPDSDSDLRVLSRLTDEVPYPTSDDVFLAGSQSTGWYAYVSDDVLKIQNISTSSPAREIDLQEYFKYQVAFSSDKNVLVLGSRYGSIHIWAMSSP